MVEAAILNGDIIGIKRRAHCRVNIVLMDPFTAKVGMVWGQSMLYSALVNNFFGALLLIIAMIDHNGNECDACNDSLCSFSLFSYHGRRNFLNALHSCDLTHDFVCRISDATSVTVLVIPSWIPYRRQRTLRSSSPSFCGKW